jgi:hypothetical protein
VKRKSKNVLYSFLMPKMGLSAALERPTPKNNPDSIPELILSLSRDRALDLDYQ